MAVRHVVLFPYPVPGHYIPLSAFAHALASCDAGIRVTIVHTEANLQRLHLKGFKGKLQMMGISDGLPLLFDRATHLETFFFSIQQMGPALQRLLEHLHATNPISCLVSDPNFPWVLDVASYLTLPLFLFVTDSAAVFSVSLHARRLLSDGFIGKGSSNDASAIVDFIPGIPALPAKSLPFPKPEHSEFFFQLRVMMLDRVGEVAGVLLNTFYELERGAVDGVSKHLSKPVLAVGPCIPEFISGDVQDAHDEKRVEGAALKSWLDGHAPASVMYICFGSLVVLEEEQIREIWEGLRASEQPFLWAIRSTVAKELEGEMRRGGSAQQGMVIEWVPQQQVLHHVSVGGFMTHCGWNSALEALSAGVPMLCCPQFLDQPLTCSFIVHVWRVGLQLVQPVQRGALARLVRLILLQEEGKLLKQQASQLCEAARASLRHSPPGSSIQSLLSFIKLLKDPIS